MRENSSQGNRSIKLQHFKPVQQLFQKEHEKHLSCAQHSCCLCFACSLFVIRQLLIDQILLPFVAKIAHFQIKLLEN